MSFYRSYSLSSVLARYIDCVWVEDYFDRPANKNRPQLIVPDNSVELVLSESTIERKQKDSCATVKCKTHLSGLKTKPQEIVLNRSSLLCIRFKAHGLYRFTQLRMEETTDKTIDPSDIFGKSFKDFEEQLFEAKDIQTRLSIVENYFFQRLVDHQNRQDFLFDAVHEKILCSQGRNSMRSLAEESGVSPKTLQRKFVTCLGVTPKKYCRLVRFFHAIQIPPGSHPVKFTDIAFDQGFYDQMHFVKETKEFTGLSPTAYFQIDRGVQQPILSQTHP